jgi:hypothetical protein
MLASPCDTVTPPHSVNFMALPTRLSSTWRMPPRVGADHRGHVGGDEAGEADVLGVGPGGQQFDDAFGQFARRHRLRLGFETPGFDLGIVE